MSVVLRPMRAEDWPAVTEVYRQGIESGDATFETAPPTFEAWDAARDPRCRLVAEVESRVVGFAAVSPTSARPVYAGVREVMVYVADEARGRGIGTGLLAELVGCAERAGIWTLVAGIFPENDASIRLHEGAGFRTVGVHERIGQFHDGRWRDTVLMERRSSVAGTD